MATCASADPTIPGVCVDRFSVEDSFSFQLKITANVWKL